MRVSPVATELPLEVTFEIETPSLADPSSDAHLGNNDITSPDGVQGKTDSSMELTFRVNLNRRKHGRVAPDRLGNEPDLELARIDSEQLRGSPAKHCPLLFNVQAGCIQDVIHRRGRPGERPVRAHDYLAGAAFGH